MLLTKQEPFNKKKEKKVSGSNSEKTDDSHQLRKNIPRRAADFQHFDLEPPPDSEVVIMKSKPDIASGRLQCAHISFPVLQKKR